MYANCLKVQLHQKKNKKKKRKKNLRLTKKILVPTNLQIYYLHFVTVIMQLLGIINIVLKKKFILLLN